MISRKKTNNECFLEMRSGKILMLLVEVVALHSKTSSTAFPTKWRPHEGRFFTDYTYTTLTTLSSCCWNILSAALLCSSLLSTVFPGWLDSEGEFIRFVLILFHRKKDVWPLLLGKNQAKIVEHRFDVKTIFFRKLLLLACA